jgi:hypothetical protein
MDSDCYKVKILHYINPHMIWLEVVNRSSSEEFLFEQVGIYGVLPLEITIELEGAATLIPQTRRCKEWAPAATLTMAKNFSDAKEVFFRPTYIDRRYIILYLTIVKVIKMGS